MSNDIVIQFQLKKGEVRLDSRIAASGFGRKSHKDFRYQVLEKYESKMGRLGVVVKKTDPKTKCIYWDLNEDQLYFVCFLVENNKYTVELKLLAVKNIHQADRTSAVERMQKFEEKLRETPLNDTPVKTQEHTVIKRRLASELKGSQEVPVDGGFIDILTKDQIIEVKNTANYETAIDQINRYSKFYPDKKKRIHLFGSPLSDQDLTVFTDLCKENDCIVTQEQRQKTSIN